MRLVQRVRHADDRAEAVHAEPRRPRKRRVGGVIGLRGALPVIARHVRHDLEIHLREPEHFRVHEKVVGVPVVPARRHVVSDVVHDGRNLEKEPLPFPHAVLRPRGFEDGAGEPRGMQAVALVGVIFPREVQRGRDGLLGEEDGRAALDRPDSA